MPAILYPVIVFLGAMLEGMVYRMLFALGFGVAAYVGLGALMTDAATYLASLWSGLPADLLAMAYLLGIDRCINLIFSAYTAKLSLMGMTAAGALARMVQMPESGG